MSETDLGRALLNVDAANPGGVPDTRQLTWQIIEHDRRHVRRLTILTLLIWLLATGLVGFVFIAFGLLLPLQAKIREEATVGKLDPQQREALEFTAKKTFQMLTLAIAGAVGILALAALSTIRLIFASRRATLRQVNASLLSISEQLKDLRAALAKPGPAPPA